MAARRPDEVKAAVMAALLAGQGVCELAAEYNLPKQTVSNWRSAAIRHVAKDSQQARSGLSQPSQQPGHQDGKRDLGEMLHGLLVSAIAAAEAGMGQVHDPAWRARQDASELGTFVGIIVDKAVRLLDAAERAAELFAPEPGGNP